MIGLAILLSSRWRPPIWWLGALRLLVTVAETSARNGREIGGREIGG